MTTKYIDAYCFVPMCINTKRNAPDKLFFALPSDMKRRNKWCNAARRDPIAEKSCKYCCEDHFSLENDVEDWMRYKIMKEAGQECFRLRLKKGVVPHVFNCQPNRTQSHTKSPRSAFTKRQVAETLSQVQSTSTASVSMGTGDVTRIEAQDMETNEMEVAETEAETSLQGSEVSEIPELLSENSMLQTSLSDVSMTASNLSSVSCVSSSSELIQPRPTQVEFGCQTRIKVRSKGISAVPRMAEKEVQTTETRMREEEAGHNETAQGAVFDSAVSNSEDLHNVSFTTDLSFPDAGCSLDDEDPHNVSISTVFNLNSSIPDAGCIDEGETSSEEEKALELEYHKKCNRESTLYLIEDDPRMFIGVDPENFPSLMKALLKFTKLKKVSIYMALRKLRLNEPNELLAKYFSRNPSSISRSLRKAFPTLALFLKTLIFWPDKEIIQSNVPLAFRAKYSKVQSIIDCFEIEIEVPSDAADQSFSWSSYKHANTVKYLVSCTPDGFINYVSAGYTGRGSDPEVIKASGFYDQLEKDTTVMADRGFKYIEAELTKRNCKIELPDSVESDTKLTQDQVRHSRSIASLRIHVERVIRRIREYKMCALHARFNHNLLSIIDHAVTIACGLVNLQGPLIR